MCERTYVLRADPRYSTTYTYSAVCDEVNDADALFAGMAAASIKRVSGFEITADDLDLVGPRSVS